MRWDVTNVSSRRCSYKALQRRLLLRGLRPRHRHLHAGPAALHRGTNADTGRSAALWRRRPTRRPGRPYQATFNGRESGTTEVEHAADDVEPDVRRQRRGQPDDNAGGVEWDDNSPARTGRERDDAPTIVLRSAVPAALQFNSINAGSPQRVPISFVATAKDTSGVAFAGKQLRYTITGANPTHLAVAIDANGNAVITDPGLNAGADTSIAYVDLNGDSIRQDNEPQASALATFVDYIRRRAR